MPYTTFLHGAGVRMHRKAYNVLRNHFSAGRGPGQWQHTSRNVTMTDTKNKRKKYSKVDDDTERVRTKQKTQRFEKEAERRALVESNERKRRQDAKDEQDWVFLGQRQGDKRAGGSNIGPTEPLTDFVGGARL